MVCKEWDGLNDLVQIPGRVTGRLLMHYVKNRWPQTTHLWQFSGTAKQSRNKVVDVFSHVWFADENGVKHKYTDVDDFCFDEIKETNQLIIPKQSKPWLIATNQGFPKSRFLTQCPTDQISDRLLNDRAASG